MFQSDASTLNELKRLSNNYSLDDLDNAIFLDEYRQTNSLLRVKIDLLLRTHGVINVINSFEILKNIKKGN